MIDGCPHFLMILTDRVFEFGFMTKHLPLFSIRFQNVVEAFS